MSAYTSIESATEPVIGTSRELAKTTAHHTAIVVVEGGPSVLLRLEGSHDGLHWTPIGTFQATPAPPGIYTGMILTAPTTTLMTHIRANLISLTGGTDPKVFASIASADDA